MNLIRALYKLGLISLLIPLAFAQELPCDQQVVVNVRSSTGEFLPDLTPSSFHANIGGHEASVASANVFMGSNRLILALDASGSMTTEGNMSRWNAIKDLVEQIVYSAPPSTSLALLVFNSQTVRKLEFGHSRNELQAAIEKLPDAHGMTSLWSSLLEASEMFGSQAPGDAVLVISDFEDNTHKANAAKVQSAFLDKRIRLFGLGIGTFDHYLFNAEDREGQEDFFALVKQSGGNLIKSISESDKDLSIFSKQLFDQIGRFYVLTLTPSVALTKPGRLNLSVVAPNGRKEKGIALAYPERSRSCIR